MKLDAGKVIEDSVNARAPGIVFCRHWSLLYKGIVRIGKMFHI
jgi:hypothetical protein